MTGSSGGQTTTTQSGPPPQVLQAYQNLNNAASSQATQPLQQYVAPIVAGFTPQQQQGFSEIGNAQGIGAPYLNAAAQEFGTATTPLWPTLPQYSADTVNKYLSPYTQDVTGALTNLYNNQNAQQASTISGNAAMHGAYGGDREAVAQALAAQQENLAQAPTLAQVQQQGFQGAQGEFNTQQQQQLAAEQANAWLASQAGFGMAGLGQQAQTQALTGANALLGSGGMQQQLAQEQLNVPYQQFLQQQAYPYQQLGFLAPIVEGTGSLSGGRGSTTSPGPSMLSQIGGLGLAGAGILGGTGAFGSSGWLTGGGSIGPGDASWTGGGPQWDWSGYNEGGRVGYAGGGPIGIDQGIPNLDLSYIPQGAPGGTPGMAGLSPFQPDVKQTTSGGGGGGGILGDLGALAGIARLGMAIFAAASGGRVHRDGGGRIGIHYDDGGVVGLLGQEKKDTGHPGGIGLPAVPAINLDYISNPGPSMKGNAPRGEGPPKPPSPPPAQQDQGLGNLLGEAKGLKDLGLFGGSSTGDSAAAAAGGRIGLAEGGMPGEGNVPVSVAAQFGGAPQNVTGTLQQLMQMPMDRLQQMAVQFPPNTQQGQMIAQALARKKATLGAGTAPAAPQAPAPSGGMAGGLGSGPGQQQQQASGPAPEDYGGTAHAMAAGGASGPGFVTEDEIDPHPIVDHSGDTVKIRYPSEGKILDLGIPSIKERRSLAAGGASGATPEFPHVSWDNGQWGVNSPPPQAASASPAITGPASNAPLLGTSQAENVPGTASPFTSSLPTANGVAVPQLSSQAFAPPTGVSPGGGMPGWFAPMDQWRPPGAGQTGPGGSMVFPSVTAYEPQMGNIISALHSGQNIPQWAGGSPPATSTSSTTSAPASTLTPDQQQLLDLLDAHGGSNFTPSDKRGGRVGLAEGGEPPVPNNPIPGELADKLKRIEDLHRENIEDPFPSFQRIIGVPTGRPGGGGFAAGGDVDLLPPVAFTDPMSGMPMSAPSDPPPTSLGIGKALKDIYAPDEQPKWLKERHDKPVLPEPKEMSIPATVIPPKPSGGIGVQATDSPSFDSNPMSIGVPASGLGASAKSGTGEPSAPSAMVTPNRAPPGTIWGTGAQAPGIKPPSGGWSEDPNDKRPPGSRTMANGQSVFPQGTAKLNSQGTPYNPTPPGGVPAGTTDAGPVITKADAAKANADVAPGTQMPVMPTDFIWGKGQVSPPGAGEVTPAPAASAAPTAATPNAQPSTPSGPQPVNPVISRVFDQTGLPPEAASVLSRIVSGEAKDFNVRYNGQKGGTTFTDYSQHPNIPEVIPSGQPHAGEKSTAAGMPQFLKSTWDAVAAKPGVIDPQFPQFHPVNQLRAAWDLAKTTYNTGGHDIEADARAGTVDYNRLAGQWPSLPNSGGADQVAGTGGGTNASPGSGSPAAAGNATQTPPVQQAAAIAQHTLANTAPEHRSAMAQWMNSPYFLAFLAGAGMLASRSPFPGVALGEGLKLAAQGGMTLAGQDNKREIADIRAEHLSDLTTVRATAAANKASNDANMMQYRYDNLARQIQSGNDSLDLRRQLGTAAIDLKSANLALEQSKLEEAKRYHDLIINRPPPGMAVLNAMMSDPNDPDRPKTVDEAQKRIAAAKQSPQAQAKLNLAIETQARIWAEQDGKAFSLNPSNFGRTFNSEGAYRQHLATLQQGINGVPTPSAVAPGGQQPTAAPSPAPGTVTQPTPGSTGAPTWATSRVTGPNNIILYRDATGGLFTPDHKQYQAGP